MVLVLPGFTGPNLGVAPEPGSGPEPGTTDQENRAITSVLGVTEVHSFFGFTCFYPRDGVGSTDHATPLGLKLLFDVWFYNYFTPLALVRGFDSG